MIFGPACIAGKWGREIPGFFCQAPELIIPNAKIMVDKHAEGKMAKAIEDQTAKMPSDLFLWTALTCMGVSFALKCMKKSHMALLVGQWAAPVLLLGVYNKIVKTEGSD